MDKVARYVILKLFRGSCRKVFGVRRQRIYSRFAVKLGF